MDFYRQLLSKQINQWRLSKRYPLGKVTTLAGESGAGKSFIASGNIVRHAQEQGIFVVLNRFRKRIR